MADVSKRAVQERQRQWILDLIRASGHKASMIARRSKVASESVTRLLRRENTLGTTSIDKIKRSYDIPGPDEYAERGQLMFGNEAELFDFESEGPPLPRGWIKALLSVHPERKPWRLRTGALTTVGCLAGDVLIVDPTAVPAPRDAVLAEISDVFLRGHNVVLARLYDPPYLLGAAREPAAYKPILIDEQRVRIIGVVMESLRLQRLSAMHQHDN